jgi:predicted PurR-regulated permease PerM
MLGVLGSAIGSSMLAPLRYQNPTTGFGFGTGIWIVFMIVLALLAGGYCAGRCAPVLGWLHGILAWALVTIFTVYVFGSIVAGVVGVASSAASTGANVAAQSAQGMDQGTVKSLANAAQQKLQQSGIDLNASGPQADQQMRQAADAATRGVARTTWWSFAMLVLGAIIAAAAGNLGFRHQPLVEEEGGAAVDDVRHERVAPTAARVASREETRRPL